MVGAAVAGLLVLVGLACAGAAGTSGDRVSRPLASAGATTASVEGAELCAPLGLRPGMSLAVAHRRLGDLGADTTWPEWDSMHRLVRLGWGFGGGAWGKVELTHRHTDRVDSIAITFVEVGEGDAESALASLAGRTADPDRGLQLPVGCPDGVWTRVNRDGEGRVFGLEVGIESSPRWDECFTASGLDPECSRQRDRRFLRDVWLPILAAPVPEIPIDPAALDAFGPMEWEGGRSVDRDLLTKLGWQEDLTAPLGPHPVFHHRDDRSLKLTGVWSACASRRVEGSLEERRSAITDQLGPAVRGRWWFSPANGLTFSIWETTEGALEESWCRAAGAGVLVSLLTGEA